MLEQLQTILSEATSEISKANTLEELNNLKVSLLGKKGRLTLTAAGMKDLSNEERPLAGKKLNETRSEITQNLEEKINSLQEIEDNKKVLSLDVTLPGNSTTLVGRHPISQMLDDSVKALRRMGFSLASGPEIETEWHCFDALNTPQDHPARNESDTFYFEDGNLLRTHTSTIQIRTMEKNHPPVRIIAPGAAYRRDEIDATHLSQFNQLEGLYVDQNVSLADLKGTLEFLLQAIFGKETPIRFRPHFFPFTEPSFEIDILLEAEGKKAKWIEIAGCGMVDPDVFNQICKVRGDEAYSPKKVSGFAFGLGLERLAMIKWGISDIRHLIENDMRFLEQF
ncbi:MAG: phenylalanine--tRNA ligase subunit alpha [Verrucomicrobiota bacterium]|nr:phenylalanine--tRNA ligase subunit alpha [Verrucomicrobiota bacterium]MEC8691577.1 phenylalanine--tRNA ligase subunit alpha [Verrucomicrobiota bacterium]